MVANGFGQHVFISMRILHHGRGVNAGFCHEGAFTDVSRVAVGRAVEHVVERPRHPHQRRHLLRRNTDLKAIGKLLLQTQRRDQRTEIGVAATFAKAIERALDLPRAGAHRGE
jgi:hypothetical protein